MVILYKQTEELLNEEKQMSGVKTKCASSLNRRVTWSNINWDRYQAKVKKLQGRIVKALQENRYGKVKALRHLLTNSFEAKALAVKRVTSNKGKRTSGVDNIKWVTPEEKLKAVNSLKKRGYKPKPLKRVFIEKSNGKKRPLGIPTMKDRAMQALYLMALEPVTEVTADYNSYGFRKKRSAHDAIGSLHMLLSKWYSPQWILEADIKGCFDHISHEWIVNNVQIDKSILNKWLKCGVVFNKLLSPTQEGTPQGGIISPTLANATLDGMERLLNQKYYNRYLGKGVMCCPKVHLVRYADDFVITAAERETLDDIKALITDFLYQRGLSLSQEKTLITHISEGFDFLGFNIRKYKGTLLIKPSKKSQKKLTEKLHEVISNNNSVSQYRLIEQINPVLTGWGNYFRHVVAKEVFSNMDHILLNQLKRWAFRRHNNKSRQWVRNKYFKIEKGRQWCFKTEIDKDGKKQIFILKKLSDIPIVRHPKIKKEANPFDPAWDSYFEKRKKQHLMLQRLFYPKRWEPV